MIKKSLKSRTAVLNNEEISVIYNLIFQNALYSIECIKEGTSKQNNNNYCIAENITDDEGEAESFLFTLVKSKVLPVHIKDMVEDYFK